VNGAEKKNGYCHVNIEQMEVSIFSVINNIGAYGKSNDN